MLNEKHFVKKYKCKYLTVSMVLWKVNVMGLRVRPFTYSLGHCIWRGGGGSIRAKVKVKVKVRQI